MDVELGFIMNEYKNFLKELSNGKKYLIVSHFNPDGDAIGSILAMGMFLEKSGKSVCMYNRDGVPGSLAFLPGSGRIVNKLPAGEKFDFAVMLDCSQRKRISDEFAAYEGIKKYACIDHHIYDDAESDINLLDSEAASTGEVVLRLMRHTGFDITPQFAECIYTTLVVDTGFFKYSNTTSDSLLLASELVKRGASPWHVAKNLEESHPVSRMRLLAESLDSLEIELDGKYSAMDVTQAMLNKTGATMDMSEEFAVYPRSVEGVEVSVLFREYDDGRIKMSLRSKDTIDVAMIARSFGGGGHIRAAGFQIKGILAEVKETVRKAVGEALAQTADCRPQTTD